MICVIFALSATDTTLKDIHKGDQPSGCVLAQHVPTFRVPVQLFSDGRRACHSSLENDDGSVICQIYMKNWESDLGR